MGWGDQLLATGLARGAAARGKRIAFGDGTTIRWDSRSEPIFRGNPNIAPRGHERDWDIEWLHFCTGHRLYNRQDGNRWVWNYEFRAIPGEIFHSKAERREGARDGRGFVVIEPNVPVWKSSSPNKDWGFARYQAVADQLRAQGRRVVQFTWGRDRILANTPVIKTKSFRDALAVLRNAALYIGPEGGLHHGAAAVGIPAVVIFGGFIPPVVTGYDVHTNLTGGAEACGSLTACPHCRAALDAISVADVVTPAMHYLAERAA